MLILQGERDYQVTMQDFAGWRRALGSRKDVTFISYPKLNHCFIEGAGKCTPAEIDRGQRGKGRRRRHCAMGQAIEMTWNHKAGAVDSSRPATNGSQTCPPHRLRWPTSPEARTSNPGSGKYSWRLGKEPARTLAAHPIHNSLTRNEYGIITRCNGRILSEAVHDGCARLD